MITARQFTLTPTDGPGRLEILLVVLAFMPAGGQAFAVEDMEQLLGIKQELFRISVDHGVTRAYAGGTQSLTLTPAQIGFIQQRLVAYPFWNPLHLDRVVEVYRWLGHTAVSPPAGTSPKATRKRR